MNKIIEWQLLIDDYKEIRSHLFSEGGMPYKKNTIIYEDTLEKIDKIIMEADDLLSKLSNQGEQPSEPSECEHQMFNRFTRSNDMSVWGWDKCSKCPHEESWQYDNV